MILSVIYSTIARTLWILIPVSIQTCFTSYNYYQCGQARVHSGDMRFNPISGLATMRERDFFLRGNLKTGSEVHPTSYIVVPGAVS
jgi:hypothetical protein